MSVDVTKNARQAALMLHAMPPQDCAWLLRNLPTAQSAQLEVLLEDLRSLGILADPTFLAQVQKMPATAFPPSRDTSSESRQPAVHTSASSLDDSAQRLESARVDILAAILKSEPAVLVALLLSMRNWSWHDELLEAMSMSQRLAVRRCLGIRENRSLPICSEDAALLRRTLLERLSQRYVEAIQAAAGHLTSNAPGARTKHPQNPQPVGRVHELAAWGNDG